MENRRIIIADKDTFFRKNLKEILAKAGYDVVGEAADGMSAVKLVRSMQPDLVLASTGLPVLNGVEVARIIDESKSAAVVLMADYHERDLVYKGREKWSVPVLVKPFDDLNLVSVLEYSYAAFNRVISLEREISRLKNDLETRKMVERAKGILMKTRGLSEEEAFKRIQQQSMKKRTSMKTIAEAIIMAYETLQK